MTQIDLDAHWAEIRKRANAIVTREPAMEILLNETVLDRSHFAESLAYTIPLKLDNHGSSAEDIHQT